MQVVVRDNNVDQALRALKKKMQREGIFREMKLRNLLREAVREARPREGRSHPPRPQARPQEAQREGLVSAEPRTPRTPARQG